MLNNYQNTPKGKTPAKFMQVDPKPAPACGSELLTLIAEYRTTGENEPLEAIFTAWEKFCKTAGPVYIARESGYVWNSDLLPLIAECRQSGGDPEIFFKAIEAHYKRGGDFFI